MFQGWNIGQMSDQNIMDEFERMLENMNLTEEKKVRFASFLEKVYWDVKMFMQQGALADATNQQEERDVDNEQQDCSEKQVYWIATRIWENTLKS